MKICDNNKENCTFRFHSLAFKRCVIDECPYPYESYIIETNCDQKPKITPPDFSLLSEEKEHCSTCGKEVEDFLITNGDKVFCSQECCGSIKQNNLECPHGYKFGMDYYNCEGENPCKKADECWVMWTNFEKIARK